MSCRIGALLGGGFSTLTTRGAARTASRADGALTAGVVPVHTPLDLKALAMAVGGKKTRMAEVAAAGRATGYVAGGISRTGSASGSRS